jgi:hypothetical protein
MTHKGMLKTCSSPRATGSNWNSFNWKAGQTKIFLVLKVYSKYIRILGQWQIQTLLLTLVRKFLAKKGAPL